MRAFAALFERLDASNSTTQKVEAMRDYFARAAAADAAWALFFLTGSRLKGTVNSRTLANAAADAAGVPTWMFNECYESVGDLSETAALLLPPPKNPAELALHEVIERFIRPMIGAKEPAQRALLSGAWEALGERERLVFHKLIRGGFRLGVQRPLVLRALAEATGREATLLESRLMGGFAPEARAFEELVSAEQSQADHRRPVPFMLASPLPPEITSPGVTLGPIDAWRAEWKYDGIRAQLIHHAESAGQGPAASLWSRGEEVVSAQFPGIVAAAAALPAGTILDGEVLAWEGDRPRSFAALQQHLNRKDARSAQPGLFDHERLVFVAFDLLSSAGQDMLDAPLSQRRAALENLLRDLPASAQETLRLATPVVAADWDQLAALRLSARERGFEGLVLKHESSPYVPGRQRVRTDGPDGPGSMSGWWKWKLDPYSVDAVLIYAQPGSGKRAGLFTDYTFGVWEEREGTRVLTPFCKAYSGLDMAEIERVDAFVRANTIKRSGPMRMVTPLLVFEIGFEGIARSTRHKSGVAVRFPRMLKWRHDKKPEDADTLEALEALVRAAER